MSKRSNKIYSIFGQIEAAAAETMIQEGIAKRIDAKFIPESARFNADGRAASFAVIISTDHVQRFENMIADLYA